MNVFILPILLVSITLTIFLGSFKLIDYKLTKDADWKDSQQVVDLLMESTALNRAKKK